MKRGVRFGRLAGVELVADWSVLIIFVLVVVSLASGTLPRWHPEWSLVANWAVASVAATLLLASILAHEMAHALVARARGAPVDQITLFVFGGIAHIRSQPKRPVDELVIAAVGPFASLALGVAFTLIGATLAMEALTSGGSMDEIAGRIGPLATVLLWLGPLNLALGLFNMIPGFPLDGGRVLRALLWWMTKDFGVATRWASAAGRATGFGLMAIGVMLLVGGGLLQGVWLVLIGWFLNNAALASKQQQEAKDALTDVPVSAVMRTDFKFVSPTTTAAELVDRHILADGQRGYPVVAGGVLVGFVCPSDLHQVRRDEWSTVEVRDVMTPVEQLVTTGPDAPAFKALELLGEAEVAQLPVLDADGRPIGLVRRENIIGWLSIHGEIARLGR